MPISLDQSEGRCVVRLDGEINIASAAGLKGVLLQALASANELRLDFAGATELDVTALQLLWAAAREARGSGKRVTLARPVPEDVMLAISEAGLEKLPFALAPN